MVFEINCDTYNILTNAHFVFDGQAKNGCQIFQLDILKTELTACGLETLNEMLDFGISVSQFFLDFRLLIENGGVLKYQFFCC